MEPCVVKCWKFLQEKSIRVQKEWLEACIEWLVEENNNQVPNDLMNLVYEQWLLADLREIAVAAFPPSLLATRGSRTLSGTYCVQVNSIMDIGHSAYSQLMKVKGQDAIDDENNEENNLKGFFQMGVNDKKKIDNGSKWKEKSARMLFMGLHDGVQAVDAIEYQPIRQLSVDNVLAGGKILLIGPLTFCDGMILLGPTNIKLLGGNVEQLMENLSQLKILSNTLNIEVKEEDVKIQQAQLQSVPQQALAQINHSPPQHHQPVQQIYNQPSKPRARHKPAPNSNKNIDLVQTKTEELIDDLDDDFFSDDIFDDIVPTDLNSCSENNNIQNNKAPLKKSTVSTRTYQTSATSMSSSISVLSKNTKNDDFAIPYKVNKNEKKCEEKPKKQVSDMKVESYLLDNFELDDDLFADDKDFILDEHYISNKHSSEQKLSNHQENKKSTSHQTFNNRIQSNDKISLSTNQTDMGNCIIPEPNLDDFFTDSPEEEKLLQQIVPVDVKNVEEISLSEMIVTDPPIKKKFRIKGWFKTLCSKLEFCNNHYKLLAIVTDSNFFARVLLADKALNSLIGYTANQVQEVVAGSVTPERSCMVKKALNMAEKALEKNNFVIDFIFNKTENIYEAVTLQSLS